MRRGLLVKGCLVLAFAGLSWVMPSSAADRRHQSGLERARRQIALGRYADVQLWLVRASAGSPADAEVAYLLGVAGGVAQNAPAAWSHNQTSGGHFVTVQLEGTASNRDAVGARTAVTAAGRHHVAQPIGGSFQSASDGRLHLGLGRADRVESVEVFWPSGRAHLYRDLKPNTGYRLKEGAARPLPLRGFSRG